MAALLIVCADDIHQMCIVAHANYTYAMLPFESLHIYIMYMSSSKLYIYVMYVCRQAVDRAYRIGQSRDVIVYRLIMAGTVEEKMYEKQVREREGDECMIHVYIHIYICV